MKNLFILVGTFFSFQLFSQNTFPTSGNTGINTTSPTQALQVNGNLQVDSSMTVQDSIKVQGRTRTFELVVDGDSKFKGDVIMKQKLRVDGLAKLKGPTHIFGTTVLDSLLKVHGNAKFFSNATVNGNFKVDATTKLFGSVVMTGISDIGSISGSDESFLLTGSDGTLYKTPISTFGDFVYQPIACPSGDVPHPMWSNGLNKLYVACPPVLVGIGTPFPEHKLDVRGDIYSSKIEIGNFDATHNGLINGYVENNTQPLFLLGKKIGGLDELLIFSVSNTGETTINNSGSGSSLIINNGAGNAFVVNNHSGYKIMQLEDNGTLQTREVKVNTNDWPDYVFDEDYELDSLQHIANYIKENGHLPGVPSANEIEQDGLNIGDMQNTQMEMLEQIYLYLIELNQRITLLEQEKELLIKENQELKELSH